MMHNILPFVGQILLLGVLIAVLPGRLVKDARRRTGVVAVLLAAGMLLPVYGLTVAQWLRSAVGDPGVLTMVIFANILSQRLSGRNLLAPAARDSLLLGVIVIGVVFYPMALGVGAYDPYHFGFAPVVLPVLVGLVSVVAWFRARRDLAIVLLLPLIAFNLNLLESVNLWDYLLDPILFFYAVVQGLSGSRFIQLMKRRSKA